MLTSVVHDSEPWPKGHAGEGGCPVIFGAVGGDVEHCGATVKLGVVPARRW
jgi:hypothetical protein